MSTQRQVEMAERDAKVLEFAIAGFTFRRIGELVGLSGSAAYRSLQRSLRATVKPAADEYRDLHRMRLETIFRTHYPEMRAGNMKATDRCLKALHEIAELMGLNAPAKIDFSVIVAQVADEMGLDEEERNLLGANVRQFRDYQKASA